MNIETNPVKDDSGNLIGRMQYYDLAGQIDLPIHALKDFSHRVLGYADLIILVFSSSNLQSFLDLQEWVKIIDQALIEMSKDKKVPKFLLVQNKIDLPSSVDAQFVNQLMTVDTRISAIFRISCVNGEGLAEFSTWLKTELFET